MNALINCVKRLFSNLRLKAFLICVFISLLPGILISVSLFTNAFYHDISVKINFYTP